MRFFKHMRAECHDRRFMRGEGHHHPRFGRSGRLARFLEHGDLRLLVLHLISQTPSHGYEIIKSIEELTGGAYAPSPGVIYPTLTMLEELGQAETTTEGAKKFYAITPAGQEALAQERAILDAILARLAGATQRETAMPVMRAMENLKAALRLKLGGRATSVETLRRVADALDELARKIEEF